MILFLVKPVLTYIGKPLIKFFGKKILNKFRKKVEDKFEEFKIKEPFDIDVKRFYLPIDFSFNCPHCKKEISYNLGDNYLSYPKTNEIMSIYTYCNECEKESEFDMQLNISVKVDTKNIRKI